MGKPLSLSGPAEESRNHGEHEQHHERQARLQKVVRRLCAEDTRRNGGPRSAAEQRAEAVQPDAGEEQQGTAGADETRDWKSSEGLWAQNTRNDNAVNAWNY